MILKPAAKVIRLGFMTLAIATFALSLVPTITAPVQANLAIARIHYDIPTPTNYTGPALETNFGVFGGCYLLAYQHYDLREGSTLWDKYDSATGKWCSPSDTGYSTAVWFPATGEAYDQGFRSFRIGMMSPDQSRPLLINVILTIWTGGMLLWMPFVLFSKQTWRSMVMIVWVFICAVFAWAAFGLNIDLHNKISSNLSDSGMGATGIPTRVTVGDATWVSLANAILLTAAFPLSIWYRRLQEWHKPSTSPDHSGESEQMEMKASR